MDCAALHIFFHCFLTELQLKEGLLFWLNSTGIPQPNSAEINDKENAVSFILQSRQHKLNLNALVQLICQKFFSILEVTLKETSTSILKQFNSALAVRPKLIVSRYDHQNFWTCSSNCNQLHGLKWTALSWMVFNELHTVKWFKWDSFFPKHQHQ